MRAIAVAVAVAIAIAAAAVAGCGESSLGSLPARVTCAGAQPGGSCSGEGTWCATTDQCGLDVRYCRCTDGTYQCTVPYTPEQIRTCTVVEEASCLIEGTGFCDREPRGGGHCACVNGVWSCDNACDGCPSTPPAEGDACTRACRYAGPPELHCQCSGTFDC